jgi:hypothetical protein
MARAHKEISLSPHVRAKRVDDPMSRVKYLYEAYGANRPDSLLRDPMVRRLLVRKFKSKQKAGRAQSVAFTPELNWEFKDWSYECSISPRTEAAKQTRPPMTPIIRYRNSSRLAHSPEELRTSVQISHVQQRRTRRLAELKPPVPTSRPRTQAAPRKPLSYYERVCLVTKSMLTQGNLEGWEI